MRAAGDEESQEELCDPDYRTANREHGEFGRWRVDKCRPWQQIWATAKAFGAESEAFLTC